MRIYKMSKQKTLLILSRNSKDRTQAAYKIGDSYIKILGRRIYFLSNESITRVPVSEMDLEIFKSKGWHKNEDKKEN
jgi:hypothetical protein